MTPDLTCFIQIRLQCLRLHVTLIPSFSHSWYSQPNYKYHTVCVLGAAGSLDLSLPRHQVHPRNMPCAQHAYVEKSRLLSTLDLLIHTIALLNQCSHTFFLRQDSIIAHRSGCGHTYLSAPGAGPLCTVPLVRPAPWLRDFWAENNANLTSQFF